uniref:Cyclic nucleotide-binding domain-containing protein n=1 Tax=Haptolina brevifila TaxID=156173 RepID=A0A7S2B7X7_9EUKA|mmetsp:Transcript_10124/g.20597  ORF Transcript_10124/g.20597 Transcript_10124/m.20597 type:complete len:188 (+) Transcript_10124:536-1099(+)
MAASTGELSSLSGGISRALAGGGRSSLSQVLSPLVEAEWTNMLEGLAPFFRERRYANGQVIFRKGDTAKSLYFITCGEVTLWEPASDALSTNTSAQQTVLGRRLVRYVNGGIFGELDFFLRNPRSFTAVASTDNCTLQELSRGALQSMQSQASGLAAALEHALLKYLSFQVNAKLGLSDGVKDAREG